MGDLFRRRLSWRSCVWVGEGGRQGNAREKVSHHTYLAGKILSHQPNKQTLCQRCECRACVYASHRWRSLLVTDGWWVLLWQASMGFISGDWLIAWFLFCEWKTAGGPGPCQSSVGSVTLTFPRRDTEHMWGAASESSRTEGWRKGGKKEQWRLGREDRLLVFQPRLSSHFSRTRRSLASALPLSLVVWSCRDFVTSCLNC